MEDSGWIKKRGVGHDLGAAICEDTVIVRNEKMHMWRLQ